MTYAVLLNSPAKAPSVIREEALALARMSEA